jgi:CRP-like cAMP-binding protein
MLNLITDIRQNRLLAELSEDELQELIPHMRKVHLSAGQLLSDSGEPIKTIYFPTNAVISLLYLMEDGASIEVAAVGNEGMTGTPVLTGGGAMPSRVEVCCEGYAYAIHAQILKREFDQCYAINRRMLLYIQALMTYIAQSALCNRRHSVDEQLCRWLLLAHDRGQGTELTMTQQMIASKLGVRREGVTEAAGKLEAAGLIRRRRGHITLLDRDGLEERTCECYSIMRGEFQRLLSVKRTEDTVPTPPRIYRGDQDAIRRTARW